MQSDDMANDETGATVAVDDHQWLFDVLASLRAGWMIVLASGALFALLALIYLWTATYKYTAALRVSATQTSNTSGGGLGALGGLAAIAGVGGMGAETATPFKLYVEGLQSREVAALLSKDDALMHIVFARQWDADMKHWHEPGGVGHFVKTGVFRMLGLPNYPWTPPGAAELQLYLGENIAIDQNIKTPLVTISIQSADPVFAVDFLTKLHLVSDQRLREQARARTESNIAYLKSALPGVSLAEVRVVLFNAIADQVQQMMLVNGSAPFAAEPFGPASASLRPTSPRPLPTLVGATIAGLFLGIAWVSLFGRARRRR